MVAIKIDSKVFIFVYIYVGIYLTLVYATGGKDFCIEPIVVDMASRVVTPRATRAGTA